MANKPTWKSRDKLNPFVENQGSNRKLHTIRKLGPTRDAPNLKLGFTTKGGYEYGQTAGLKLWIQAQKSGVPTDQKKYHTVQHTSGSAGQTAIAGASGSLLTTKEDTPFIRFTPKPYRSTSRAIVFNSGSADTHFLHITSSQYTTLASGTAGTKNKTMSWNMWIKPTLTGSNEKQFPSGTTRYIFSKRSGSWGASNREYDLAIQMSGSMRFRLFDESVGKTVVKNVDLSISGSAIQAGVWQNVCVTYSGKTGSITHQGLKIYRNGLLVSSGNAGTTQSGYVATENKGGDFVIGTAYTGSNFVSGSNFFRGKMAEIALWHVALEENEVKALYDARRFFGRMDTSAIDHLRQGVSILTNKQRWRSSNAPKISGISRLSPGERVSHEQDQTLYGQGKIFRDDTPFEEMADAGRLRKQIDRTIVGSKASSSIEFNGYFPNLDDSGYVAGLILTGANGTKRVFGFTNGLDTLSAATLYEFTASEYLAVVASASIRDLHGTSSIGWGTEWAKVFTSRVNGQTSALQIKARRAGNVVKLISTVTGTGGNTYLGWRNLFYGAHTGSRVDISNTVVGYKYDINKNPAIWGWITGTYNTASLGAPTGREGTFTFIGGNTTMKHVVTQALGGAIDYLRDPGKQQYPVIITNVSMRDPSQFDGNIEPLIIRDSVSHTSIDAPFVAHDVRGTFMGGEGNILFGSSQIEQFYDNKNPASSDTQVKSAPAGARRFSAETIPFFDAQDVVFALPAKPSYAYLRFACVPNNHDKIVMTDASGQQVCFEFVNSTNLSTRSFGKLRNRPHKSGGVAGSSGRGTWRVLLTGTSATAPGTGVSLTTGSQTTSAVAAAMSLFRNEIGLAQTHRRLMLTCSDRRLTETYTSIVDEETTTHVVSAGPFLPSGLMSTGIAGTTYTYSTAVGKRTYVRLDQLASGSDGNRVIDFRFRGASSGTYIVNGVTASNAYQAIITTHSGVLDYQNRRTRIKFIRNLAYRKFGMGFVSGSNMFILPMDGFIAEITRKITPFSDNKMMAVRRIKDGLNVGPATLLTSTLGGIKEWNELGHGYKSSGTGFTYNNDMFGTDSIAFGGRKR